MKALVALWFCALTIVAVGAEPVPHSRADYRPLLLQQAARYPAMTVQDCYKLLYQACNGSEHAVSDEAMAAGWLESEWAKLGPTMPDELLFEPISPDGALVRVNLRAFRDHGGSVKALAHAFFVTAGKKAGTGDALATVWLQVEELAAQGRLPFDVTAARAFDAQMAKARYPPAHHSAEYGRAYHPAYRVIERSLLRGLGIL